MDTLAQRYHTRPSEFLRINDPWLALDLDIAIASQGTKLESEAIEAVRKNGDKPPVELTDKSQGNEMFLNLVKKTRRMKGLR